MSDGINQSFGGKRTIMKDGKEVEVSFNVEIKIIID